jgi:hypothetical protein
MMRRIVSAVLITASVMASPALAAMSAINPALSLNPDAHGHVEYYLAAMEKH